jgi:hypothetical protein
VQKSQKPSGPATTFCLLAPSIYESPVCILVLITLLAQRISWSLLCFCKNYVGPSVKTMSSIAIPQPVQTAIACLNTVMKTLNYLKHTCIQRHQACMALRFMFWSLAEQWNNMYFAWRFIIYASKLGRLSV